MAINDKPITGFEELAPELITEDTDFVVAEANVTYKLPMSTMKDLTLQNMYDVRPLGEMSLTAGVSQDIDDLTYQVITAFDKIQYERNVTVSIADDRIGILQDGNYRLTASIVSEFDKAISIEFTVLVNGSESETLGAIQGLGATKGVYIGGSDIDPLVAGDYVQLAAKSMDPGTESVLFQKVRLTVERV